MFGLATKGEVDNLRARIETIEYHRRMDAMTPSVNPMLYDFRNAEFKALRKDVNELKERLRRETVGDLRPEGV